MRPLFVRTGVLLAALTLAPLALASAQVTNEEFADRRAALARLLGDGVVLAVGNAAPPQDYIPFFQNSSFRYLTGFTETNAVLLMVVEGGQTRETLFVNPRDPSRETWEGYRVGAEGSRAATGIAGRSVGELGRVVDSLLTTHTAVRIVGPYNPVGTVHNDVTQQVLQLTGGREGVTVQSVNGQVNQLRAIKSAGELELLRKTTAVTVAAHREVAGALAPGKNEFEIQALIEYTFRRYGAERPAFASIVGSGPNSTILHYNANDRFMEDGDVVVIDIGSSWGGYAADITRTYPVNGRFTPAQRDVYQLVRSAQAAAEAVARPGVATQALDQAASRTLAEGLTRLGLIEGPDATYEGPGGRPVRQLQLYYMHGLGHGIGLDVHDPRPSTLEPGAAFSVEPGVYVRPNLLTEIIPDTPANRRMIEAIRPAYERYRNIGVRIEDDFIVTTTGVEWITPAPREIEDIEAAMAGVWTGPAERNAAWVEWYRGIP